MIRWGPRLCALSALLWLGALVTGLIVLFVPEPTKHPLVPAANWQLDGVISEAFRPQDGDVSRSIKDDPDSRFFSVLDPASAPTTGVIRSRPFVAPAYIAIPYAGYPDEHDVDLSLECLGSGRRIRVAHGNAHEVWVERTIRLGGWCRTLVRIVASSSSKRYWIAVGTPFASSRLAWLKESVFVHVVVHSLAWSLLLGPGFVVGALLRSRASPMVLILITSVVPALGYAQFFLSYYTPSVAQAVVVIVWVGAVAGTVVFLRDVVRASISRGVVLPVAAAFLVSWFAVGLLYAGDVGAGSFDATYRFDPAIWSTDNQLPQIVAEAVYQRRSLSRLLGAWHVSDRPPLMSGVFLLARPIWRPLLARGDNVRLLYLFYQVTGVVESCLWVVPIWILLASAGFGCGPRLWVVILMASLGPVLFNSTYIWPKMLAGWLTLAGCLLLARAGVGAWRDSVTAGYGGVLTGLGLMAHSGVVFGLPFGALAALSHRRAHIVQRAMAFGVATAVVVLPWIAWQRVEDPPGNALTKFAFAGTYGFDQPDTGLVETVRAAYANVSLRQWLGSRAAAVHTLLDDVNSETSWLYLRDMDAIGRERLDDFLKLGQSFRIANVAWLILLWSLIKRRPEPRTASLRACAAWAAIGLGGVLLNVVATWSVHITHTQSYLSLLLIAAGLCAAIILATPLVRLVLVAGHTLYFVIVWVWSPLKGVNVAEGPLLASVLAASLLVMFAIWVQGVDGDVDTPFEDVSQSLPGMPEMWRETVTDGPTARSSAPYVDDDAR
jgi:hypothetical protein